MEQPPRQQPLTDEKNKPIAPIHNACFELAQLKAQQKYWKDLADKKTDEIHAMMEDYKLITYHAAGVDVTLEEKATVKVSAGVQQVLPDGTQMPQPPGSVH